jgi:hypothetical protein
MQPHEVRCGAVIESAGRSGLRKCRRAQAGAPLVGLDRVRRRLARAPVGEERRRTTRAGILPECWSGRGPGRSPPNQFSWMMTIVHE